MDWRALSVFALIVGLAAGFAIGWHMGSQQSMDAAYQRGVEESRRKLDESKYAAQTAASNARVAEINRQIELEKRKNEELSRSETSSVPRSPERRRASTEAVPPAAQPTPPNPRPDDPRPTWAELEKQQADKLRAEQQARQRAEQQARSEHEAQENQIVYIAAGMYHRYGCPFLTEPLVRAKLKDARMAAAPCSYCKPPR